MYFANLKMTSAFKLIFLSSLMGFLILALVFGVMATFGYDTVRMNGRPVHGLLALPASFLIAFFIALLFSAFRFGEARAVQFCNVLLILPVYVG